MENTLSIPDARASIEDVTRRLQEETVRLSDLSAVADSLPRDLRERLLAWRGIAVSLGDFTVAGFFNGLAKDVHANDACKLEIHLEGLGGRNWVYHQLDPILPTVGERNFLLGGSGTDSAEFEVSAGLPAAVTLSTAQDEPAVSVPVAAHSFGILRLDFSRLPKLPAIISDQFLWIPAVSGTIGGDLLARNSVSKQDVQVGPLAVQRKHVTIGRYLADGGSLARAKWLGQKLFDETGVPTEILRTRDYRGTAGFELPLVGLSLEDIQLHISDLESPPGLAWRLLTSDEWEMLACGPEHYRYPWGDIWLDGACNVRSRQYDVGLDRAGSWPFDISRWGLIDSGGNVEEWTMASEDWPVARGGSWYNDRQMARCASRIDRAPDYRHPKLGFRLVLS